MILTLKSPIQRGTQLKLGSLGPLSLSSYPRPPKNTIKFLIFSSEKLVL